MVIWVLTNLGRRLSGSSRSLSDEENYLRECLSKQLAGVGDERRPLAGATDCGRPPETEMGGLPVKDRWAGRIEKTS
jgi:hypothetical protein